MSKTLYAPRRVNFYSEGDFGLLIGGAYIVDVASLTFKKECVFYKNNEAVETKTEVDVNFPRESRRCAEIATLAPDEIFEKYEDCLAYVKTLNKKVQDRFGNKYAERLEAERKDADEYINNLSITV